MTEDLLGELFYLMLLMLNDSELVAEFDDRVTISVAREDYEEVRRLMYQYEQIADTLHCNDADEGC